MLFSGSLESVKIKDKKKIKAENKSEKVIATRGKRVASIKQSNGAPPLAEQYSAEHTNTGMGMKG
jgi:hypothetical protein